MSDTTTHSQAPHELIPFQYSTHPVRTVVIDHEPWFVLADLCKVLGLSANIAQVRNRLDDGACQAYPIADSLGRTQTATIVSEPGMYEVVIRSDKPDAINFRRWITGTVLPTIRKTGTYSTAPALTDDELIHQALSISATRVAALTERVAQLEPKAEYVDIFVAGSDVMSFRTVASTLDISEGWLRRELIDRKWIYVEETSRWSNSKGCKIPVRRYSERSDKKVYFQRCETHEAPRFRGEVMHTLKITAEGAQAISRMVPRWMKENAA